MIKALTFLFRGIWNEGRNPFPCGESVILLILKKGMYNGRGNREINSIQVFTKVFASLMLRRLIPIREKMVSEQQGAFLPDRGCIEQVFNCRKLLEGQNTVV